MHLRHAQRGDQFGSRDRLLFAGREVFEHDAFVRQLVIDKATDKINAKQLAAEASKKQAASMRPLAPEQAVERWLVMNAKVQLNPGNTYGLGGANHMRMNIALSRRTLQAALNSMQNALKSPALSTAAI